MRQTIYGLSNLVGTLNNSKYSSEDIARITDDLRSSISKMPGPTVDRFRAWLDLLATMVPNE